MAEPADLSPTIVESLYCEALVLADEARAVFDLSGRLDLAGEDEDLARVALSLRTERFHARIARLDKAWRDRFAMHPSAIHRLRDRIGRELGAA